VKPYIVIFGSGLVSTVIISVIFGADIFKLKYSNKRFYGISSNRYCLYDIVDDTIVIDDEKYSAHGLRYLLDSFKNESDEKSTWYKDFWKNIIDLHYDKITHESLHEKYPFQNMTIHTMKKQYNIDFLRL
jgi:hypothetical protein